MRTLTIGVNTYDKEYYHIQRPCRAAPDPCYDPAMNLVVSIPDQLATRLSENGPDLGRQALEALVLENFRAGRMSTADVREALGFEVLDQVDGFLKAHGAYEDYSMADIERGRRALDQRGLVEPEPVNLAEAIRRRFASVGGVDDLVILPRDPAREPPRFDR